MIPPPAANASSASNPTWFGNFDYLKSRQWSFDAAVDFMLKNHVTLINDNIGRVPPEAMGQLQKLARLAGYRFVLREMSHEPAAKPGGALNVTMKWSNVGVGRLYRPYVLRFMLIDAAGQTAFSHDSRATPQDWFPGDHDVAAPIPLPATLKPGAYHLAITLADPDNHRPPIRLAIETPERDALYTVSEVEVK